MIMRMSHLCSLSLSLSLQAVIENQMGKTELTSQVTVLGMYSTPL